MIPVPIFPFTFFAFVLIFLISLIILISWLLAPILSHRNRAAFRAWLRFTMPCMAVLAVLSS